jgi:pyruvate/2-oxoglutarate dehydrogenase complex dihydrolipoamide acyltransferase (E2) component
MAIVLKVPPMGESVVEGTINKWFVEVGQVIAKDQPIVELLTDKVNVSVPADADGVLLEILAPVGTVVPVGKEIAVIGVPGEKATASREALAPAPAETIAKQAPQAAPPSAAPNSEEQQRLSPAVRRLVKEHGIDVTRLKGSGAGGRVTQKDVEDYVAGMKQASTAAPKAAPPASGFTPGPARMEGGKLIEEIPIPRVRKLISEHMVKSKHTSPHVTTFDECDFTRIV